MGKNISKKEKKNHGSPRDFARHEIYPCERSLLLEHQKDGDHASLVLSTFYILPAYASTCSVSQLTTKGGVKRIPWKKCLHDEALLECDESLPFVRNQGLESLHRRNYKKGFIIDVQDIRAIARHCFYMSARQKGKVVHVLGACGDFQSHLGVLLLFFASIICIIHLTFHLILFPYALVQRIA